MSDKIYNVLFLCTGNSARSIFGECLVKRWGAGRFRGFSAGSQPRGSIHPYTLEVLERNNHKTNELRSKSWDEFATSDAPVMDFVFTVCGSAAEETCPVWPGQPISAHWGVDDPARAEGADFEIRAAFNRAYRELQNRVSVFVNLPLHSLDRLRLQRKLDDIGSLRLQDEPAETTD